MARARRGFTLIELMVALTGGLLFAMFTFTMTRDISRFFQNEALLSDASMNTLGGFQRMRHDIARAGFMASPNLRLDPKRCPAPLATNTMEGLDSAGYTGNAELQKMAALRVDSGASEASAGAGIAPDRLTLWGNYTTSESFPVRAKDPGVSGDVQLILEAESQALLRTGYDPNNSTSAAALLSELFPTGSILRVEDDEGRIQFGLVGGTSVTSYNSMTAGRPQILITQSAAHPAVIGRSEGGALCGPKANWTNVRVNPINIIRYELADLSTTAPYDLFYSNEAPTDLTPVSLVRRELNPNGTLLSTELVADYAVDLKFGLLVVDDVLTRDIEFLEAGNAEIDEYGDPIAATPAATPHLIRGVDAQLSVRSRVGDRFGDINDPNVADGLYRIPLKGNGTGGGAATNTAGFARVRTLRSQIAVRNTRNVLWNY